MLSAVMTALGSCGASTKASCTRLCTVLSKPHIAFTSSTPIPSLAFTFWIAAWAFGARPFSQARTPWPDGDCANCWAICSYDRTSFFPVCESVQAAAIRASASGAGKDPRARVTAQIFWLKTRAGWKETTLNEHTGKDGRPIVIRISPEDADL